MFKLIQTIVSKWTWTLIFLALCHAFYFCTCFYMLCSHVWCQQFNWQSLLGGSFVWHLDVIWFCAYDRYCILQWWLWMFGAKLLMFCFQILQGPATPKPAWKNHCSPISPNLLWNNMRVRICTGLQPFMSYDKELVGWFIWRILEAQNENPN